MWLARSALVSAALLGLVVTATPALAAPPPPDGIGIHPSGIEVLAPLPAQVDPMPEAAAATWHQAMEYAEKYPTELGYPWVDLSTGEVYLDAVGAAGLTRVQGFEPTGEATAPVRSRDVPRSFAELEGLKHEVIELTAAQLSGGDAIYQTESDGESNRTVITVAEVTDDLLYGLAERYDPASIAVREDPAGAFAEPSGRQNDTSPFYGGAHIVMSGDRHCTSGFPWMSGSTPMMLTAGHCLPYGGRVNTPVRQMGYVTSGSRENWNPTTGTVLFPGQSVYRGDLALITVDFGSVAAFIYSGGSASFTTRSVRQMWSRQSASGDLYCTGGQVSGELCGWQVRATRIDVRYSGGAVARNVHRGSKEGHCTRPGDSGGPVYTVRSDGGVAGKGIHSGHGGGGGDYYGGAFDPCHEFFTDIWEAYYGLPGYLLTR